MYEADKFRYHKKAKESNYYDDELVIRGTLEREINIKRILGIILCAEEEKPLQIKLRKLLEKHYPEFYYPIKKKSLELFDVVVKKQKPNTDWMDYDSQITIPYYIVRLLYGFENIQFQDYDLFVQDVENWFIKNADSEPSFSSPDSQLNQPEYITFIKKYEDVYLNIKSCVDIAAQITGRVKRIRLLEQKDIRHEIFQNIAYITSMFRVQGLMDTTFTGLITLTKDELREIFNTIIV